MVTHSDMLMACQLAQYLPDTRVKPWTGDIGALLEARANLAKEVLNLEETKRKQWK